MTPSDNENHQTGLCPDCGYRVYLDARGLVRGHMKRVDGVYTETCDGHQKAPVKDEQN